MSRTLGFTGKVHDKTYADPGLFRAALVRTGIKRPGLVTRRPVPRLREHQFTNTAELHQIHDFEPGADHRIKVAGVRKTLKVQVWAKAPDDGVWMVDAEGKAYWVHLKTGVVREHARAYPLGRLAS